MGIYVRLKSKTGEHIPLREASLNRLHYANELVRFFFEGRIFVPENIEIWHHFPNKSLGGERKDRFPKDSEKIIDPFREIALLRRLFTAYSFDQIIPSIIRINGVWDINGTKLAGFLSVNNNFTWRRVYRDIEMDAYGKGDIEDLVDALWKFEEISSIIDNFIKKMTLSAKNQSMEPREIYLTIGVPVKGEPENLMAIHFPDKRDLIEFYYSTLSKLGEPEIKDKMNPLDKNFFISAISEHKTVERRLRKTLDAVAISEQIGNSVTYIARERNSFSKLYEQLYETVFKPAMKDLPRSKHVKSLIIKGLEKIKSLD